MPCGARGPFSRRKRRFVSHTPPNTGWSDADVRWGAVKRDNATRYSGRIVAQARLPASPHISPTPASPYTSGVVYPRFGCAPERSACPLFWYILTWPFPSLFHLKLFGKSAVCPILGYLPLCVCVCVCMCVCGCGCCMGYEKTWEMERRLGLPSSTPWYVSSDDTLPKEMARDMYGTKARTPPRLRLSSPAPRWNFSGGVVPLCFGGARKAHRRCKAIPFSSLSCSNIGKHFFEMTRGVPCYA